MKIYRSEKSLKFIFPIFGTSCLAKRILFRKKDSFLYETGWLESLKRGHPCRQNGEPLPWLNHAITFFLESRLDFKLSLFEWGSGYSTQYFSQKVGTVTSVEHNEKWYEIVKGMAPDNVKILFVDKDIDGQYCRAIHMAGNLYDIVLVDGRDRVNCIREGIEKLSKQGVLLLDDAERDRYKVGIDYAINRGFLALEFEGLKPMGHRIGRTVVFYRPGNCLGI